MPIPTSPDINVIILSWPWTHFRKEMKYDKETWHLAVSASLWCFWETRLSASDITPFNHSTEGRDSSVLKLCCKHGGAVWYSVTSELAPSCDRMYICQTVSYLRFVSKILTMIFRNVLGYVVTQNSKCCVIMAVVSIVTQRRISNDYKPTGKAFSFLSVSKKNHKIQNSV